MGLLARNSTPPTARLPQPGQCVGVTSSHKSVAFPCGQAVPLPPIEGCNKVQACPTADCMREQEASSPDTQGCNSDTSLWVPRCACWHITHPTSIVRMTGWAHESTGAPSGCGAPQLMNSTPNGKRAASFTMCRYCISSCRARHHSQGTTACRQWSTLLWTMEGWQDCTGSRCLSADNSLLAMRS